ncbi:SUMF1/EgtB/PvdO family nonheme iron enzyme [Pontibacter sp. JAM-7]|uniref:SUMF1/EgtB/PvdO family nonheme iron enzyme n=1 Tax=Pontibacter sp. JAM-7 TaxID=3366581 RepID=UPI003AF96003
MTNGSDSTAIDLQPGQLIGPEHRRFKLLQPLGNLPFASLWLAEDCLVKDTPKATLLFPHCSRPEKPLLTEALKRHATLSKQLQSKFLLEGYGSFQSAGKDLFLAYAPIQGLTLQQLLDKKQLPAQPQLIILLKQLAHALDSGFQILHLPHGLLTPELIFIQPSQGIKLLGFELSESLSHLPAEQNLQHADPYQPPEAERHHPLTRQADVFSYACLVYQLLGGQTAFAADTPLQQRNGDNLRQAKGITDEQFKLLKQALAADPAKRPPSCSALARGLFVEPDTRSETATPASAKAAPQPEPQPSAGLLTQLVNLPVKQIAIASSLFLLGVWVGWFSSGWFNEQSNQQQLTQINVLTEQLRTLQQDNQEYASQSATNQALLSTQTQQLTALQAELASLSQQRAAQAEDPAIQVFRDQINGKRYGPEMVILPAGSFQMGDISGEGDDNETPLHTVNIAKPFALSRFEVSFAEYDLFAASTGRTRPEDSGWGRENMPVTNVSWQDAVAYTRWLSNTTGQPYRLPSEAEWEYAARAGTTTTFWWGNELRDNMAVCDECGSQWDGKQPAPVGSFPANPWGLHDMTGNVDEWVADCYQEHYDTRLADGRAFLSSGCQQRVMRGGSWFEISRLIRPSSRYRHPANSRRNSWGFRIALDLTQPTKDSVNE